MRFRKVPSRLLRRSSRLPFPRERRRELLCRAALVRAEVDGDGAIELFDALFDEDASDDIATRSMARFAELLDAAGAHAKLAARWEQVARGRARAGDAGAACNGWCSAGSIWEAHGDLACAIAAFRQGAALSSETSFEALARIHEGRQEWKDAANALEWLKSHAYRLDF